MPTFEIVIPTYNAARYLPLALESVIAQTFQDWRIVLVDDGSQDNTPELVQLYQARLSDKLLYIRQANGGMSAARNTALRHCTAEYIAMLDADDVWLPQRLQRAFEIFQATPKVGLTYGFVARIDPEGNTIDVVDRRNPHGEGQVAPYLYMRMLDVPCPTVTFRRSCLDYAGLFDESLGAAEDRDLWIRITARMDAALIPEVVALYRISPKSVSSNIDRLNKAQKQLIAKLYGTPGCGWRARRVALSWVYRQRAETLFDQGLKGPALLTSLRALTFYPFQVHTVRTTASLALRFFGLKRGANPHLAARTDI